MKIARGVRHSFVSGCFITTGQLSVARSIHLCRWTGHRHRTTRTNFAAQSGLSADPCHTMIL